MGKTVFLDPAPVPEKFPYEILPYLDFIKPKETEAAMQEAKDIANGKIEAKVYRSAGELFAELDAER